MSGTPDNNELFAVQQRLEDADAELAGTLAHLERLKIRRHDDLVLLNQLASPFLRLPPELICDIFICCLPPPRTLPSPRDAPLLLGQVCHQWRNIALSFPVLWSSICLAAVFAASHGNGLLALLDTWLERSGNSHLSLSIVLGSSENHRRSDLNQIMYETGRSSLFRKVRHSSYRWRELEVVRRLEDLPAIFQRDDPWHLPQLVKLTLLLSQGTRPQETSPGTLSNFTEAPALREVHLQGFSPRTLLLPWWQLTIIHTENLLPLEVLETLAQSTSLIDATFSLWPTQFFRLPSDLPVGRPSRLKSLSLFGEMITPILDFLYLPPFQCFSISFGPHNDLSHLIGFLLGHQLTTVSIDVRAVLPLNDLASLLLSLPHVETLSFGAHNGLMNGVLPHALCTNADLLPALRRLTVYERVDRYNEPPLDAAVVVNMLRARWATGLKSLCLVSTHVFREVHPGFFELAKEGMDIELRSHGSGPFLVVYFNTAQVH
ncbi:hypothetical protein GGX14DRAFT_653358 [Mycena pura]|uniref:F-box domain-containing protein n=1 Tax=Mycena pura TaxID=153505 RepID=A0AAD6V8P3_9AGAR|nr:hypothetical protein GGX14DRAFT_653358 [Mycena pura]